jgi:predicted permease
MGWLRRARGLFSRNKLSQEWQDELDFHLSMREQLNLEQGMPSEEARRNARVRFGGTASLLERLREIDLLTLPDSIWQDVCYSARMLMKYPGFTAVAVLALTLGISLNTTVFTAYKAIVRRSLDARDPARMVNISLTRRSGNQNPMFSYPDYLDYREGARSFDGIVASAGDDLTLTGVGGAPAPRPSPLGSIVKTFGFVLPGLSATNTELIRAQVVSENYFSVLGLDATRGRTFSQMNPAEFLSSPSVMISDNYWKKRFAGDTEILGKVLRLNGVAVSVVGVTPNNFVGTGIAAPDLWVPFSLEPLFHSGVNPSRDREDQRCRIFGRLANGVSLLQAQAEITARANRIRNLHSPHSEASEPATAELWPGSPFGRKPDATLNFAVFLIMLAVGMVLAIACGNVASLQLARSAARQHELSMRVSLGASRLRIVRQLLTESALLGLLCGVVALFLTWGLLHVLATELSNVLPMEWGSLVIHVTPDLEVFAYVFAISLMAGVFFGLVPALESSRAVLSSSLKEHKGTSSFRSRKLRAILTAAQVAVSLALLVAGSLLIRGSVNALDMETGYDGKHVINVEIQFPDQLKYSVERKRSLLREIRSRIEGLSPVAEVTVGRAPDGDGVRTATVRFSGEESSARDLARYAFYTYVHPNYFETLGIAMVAGRTFNSHQGAAEQSVILSASQAAQLWPGQNPIGRELALDTKNHFSTTSELLPDKVSYQVIGVVKDTRGVQIDGSDNAQIYLPLPENHLDEHPMLVRTRSDPTPVTAGIGATVSAVDPDLVAYTATLDEMLHSTPPFIVSRCAAAFASLVGIAGLLLASLGIYGTVSYVVVLRTSEMGIRMALGASKGDVLRLVLVESTRPVLAGIAVGLVLAIGVSHVLSTLLYGLDSVDAVSFAGVSALLFVIALLAAYLPSMRALRVDPAVALRYE